MPSTPTTAPPDKVDGFLKPLLEASRQRIAGGRGPLFQSHMFDGSVVPLDENLEKSRELLAECAELDIILEVEAGCVGGEEDGHDTSGLPIDKLYTTPGDMVDVYEALQPLGRFIFAATFGNVHGSYKPGAVKLKPTILRDGQKAVMDKHGRDAEMDLVFHGGSGSSVEEIRETLDYGVVKMNIDTDTQYAFTRAVADYMFEKYDEVLKVDGEVGVKKTYDPRAWLKVAESPWPSASRRPAKTSAALVKPSTARSAKPPSPEPPAPLPSRRFLPARPPPSPYAGNRRGRPTRVRIHRSLRPTPIGSPRCSDTAA